MDDEPEDAWDTASLRGEARMELWRSAKEFEATERGPSR